MQSGRDPRTQKRLAKNLEYSREMYKSLPQLCHYHLKNLKQFPVLAGDLGNSGHASILGGRGSPAFEYPPMNATRELSTGFNTTYVLQ